MAVTLEDVRAVARLARLQFDAEEEEALTVELNRILEYMDKLKGLDTEDVEPTSHVVPITSVFRGDEVEAFPRREALLEAAPQRQGDYFKVPRIID